MDANDFWTHVGLVTSFFAVVVGPRLFLAGQTLNSAIYIILSVPLIQPLSNPEWLRALSELYQLLDA